MQTAGRKLIKKREAAQKYGCSIRHLHRLTARGKFPKPIKRDPDVRNSAALYFLDEVDAQIEKLARQRDGGADEKAAS
jgi:predicted DNA-binding transcriptional regulator AlpA